MSRARPLNRSAAAAARARRAVQRALKPADRSRGIYPALGELARRYGGVDRPT